jgi:hypothetical protein
MKRNFYTTVLLAIIALGIWGYIAIRIRQHRVVKTVGISVPVVNNASEMVFELKSCMYEPFFFPKDNPIKSSDKPVKTTVQGHTRRQEKDRQTQRGRYVGEISGDDDRLILALEIDGTYVYIGEWASTSERCCLLHWIGKDTIVVQYENDTLKICTRRN